MKLSDNPNIATCLERMVEEAGQAAGKSAVLRSVAVGWYSPEAWRQLAAIPEARIEKSYAEYLHDAAAAEKQFIAAGMKVVKVAIDVAQMTEWCHRHSYEIDNKSRAAYGAVLAMAREDSRVLTAPVKDDTRGAA